MTIPEKKLKKINFNARHKTRRFAVQAIYQWQLTGHDINKIEEEFLTFESIAKADIEYFRELIHNIPAKLDVLDQTMQPFLDRPLAEVDPIELAILRIGIYELAFRLDIPFRVVLNEAIELAKTFGGADGHKYVNGILDQTAQQLRRPEIQATANKT